MRHQQILSFLQQLSGVGVVTAADHIRVVGIGGRSSSHFISDELLDRQRRVLVGISLPKPPIVVTRLLTTAMLN